MGGIFTGFRVFTDGASRGNPGRAAVAFIILSDHDTIEMKGSKVIGVRTNNQAEYEAVIFALEAAKQLQIGKLTCYLDSLLVVNQLNGEYKVLNPQLRRLWSQVLERLTWYKQVTFNHVPRDNKYIKIVDQLANRRLDSELT
jgi:ribonuclease HI